MTNCTNKSLCWLRREYICWIAHLCRFDITCVISRLSVFDSVPVQYLSGKIAVKMQYIWLVTDQSQYICAYDTCWYRCVVYQIHTSNKKSPRFIHRSTAAIGLLPIERASKTDPLTILAVYQHQYSNTNLKFQFIKGRHVAKTNTKLVYWLCTNIALNALNITTRDHNQVKEHEKLTYWLYWRLA